jgi:hypothetical protein
VLVDEGLRLSTDATGLLAQQGLADGYHALRFRHGGKDHATYFKIKREFLTVMVLEISPDGSLASSAYSMDHTFLSVLPFKRLLAFHLAVARLLDLYRAARSGRALAQWERLLADEYSDGLGGKEDLMRSLRLHSAHDGNLRLRGSVSELFEKTATVVARIEQGGRPDFVRLDLKATATDAWRIATIRQ